ncbi:MAG TPA: substrate-binding domain-containing protein [Solirubrobacteraceae bacterium]
MTGRKGGLGTCGPLTIVVALAGLTLVLSACGGASRASSTGGKQVSALYAGSLVELMEEDIGPAFQKADGYGFEGYGGGSNEVAAEIRGNVRQGDVFVSAAASADQELEGSANGDWVSWYATFASSPLVLAYNPKSRFGAELRRGVPWYEVIAQPGILVGRTEPKLDPKGKLTVEAVDEAATKLHDPALTKALRSFPVFPETALVGRLQSGQLDAGFFYAIEASAAHLATVPLTPVYKVADYTVTILNRNHDPSGAAAFVRYLLSPRRTPELKQDGLTGLTASFSGEASAVPQGLRGIVGAG